MESLSYVGRSLLGVAIFLGIAILLSKDRKNINWRLVVTGVGIHFLMAFLMLRVPIFNHAIDAVSHFFIKVLDFSEEGATFLFGSLVTDQKGLGYIVAVHMLPSIIFFSAISSVLYFYDILPKFVHISAKLLNKTLKLSGSECAAAAANVFLGQITAPLLIKPYLPNMSRAQVFSVMTVGMATIAGSVMIAFIGILGGDDPQSRLTYATHLLTASTLSAPAALVMARILMPTKDTLDDDVVIAKEDIGVNVVDAIANGTGEGLRIALIIGATLIVFTAFIAMVNWGFGSLGNVLHINPLIHAWSDGLYNTLTLQGILGFAFAPVAWLMGVDSSSLLTVGQLIGEKVVASEFVAYLSLGNILHNTTLLDPRSAILASYALCGFANFTSMGVQISGLSAIAPNQRQTVSELAFLALIGGSLTNFMNACVAGIFLQ